MSTDKTDSNSPSPSSFAVWRSRLLCPVCLNEKMGFRASPGENEDSPENGILDCRQCKHEYPVVDSIPVLVPPELMSRAACSFLTNFNEDEEFAQLKDSFKTGDLLPETAGREDDDGIGSNSFDAKVAEGEQGIKAAEIAARDKEAEQYHEIFDAIGAQSEEKALLNALSPIVDWTVLDLGCGTGRFTLPLTKRAHLVVGVDFSFESLRRLRNEAKSKGMDNVFLICGDASKVPLSDSLFDGVLSAQLVEHIPGNDGRRSVIQEIGRLLKPKGKAVVDFYNWSFFQPRFTKRTQRVKEGTHGNDIPFYRMHRSEFKTLLEAAQELKLQSVSGVRSLTMLNLDRKLVRVKLTFLGCWIESILTATRMAKFTGYCLLTTLTKK